MIGFFFISVRTWSEDPETTKRVKALSYSTHSHLGTPICTKKLKLQVASIHTQAEQYSYMSMDWRLEVLCSEGDETMERISKGGCGCPLHGSAQVDETLSNLI